MMESFFRWFKPEPKLPTSDPLDQPLLYFGNDALTLRACLEGILVVGATGSGKTSGSGAAIGKAFLQNGFGGMVTCCKPDEAELWQAYARDTGRENDLVLFGPRHKHRFNFLNFASSLTPADTRPTENLTQLLGTITDVANRGQAANSQDPYWSRASQQLIRNAVDLVLLALGSFGLTLMEVYQVIISAPTDAEQLRSVNWQKSSRCMQLLTQAHRRRQGATESHDLEITSNFWLKEFPNLNPRTRGCVVSMVTTGIDPLLRGTIHNLINTTTTITPSATHQGKILVLDVPAKSYHAAGVLIQLIFKELWQQATEARLVRKDTTPTFLFIDEAQTFLTKSDATFLMTARSSRACTVFLTQNIPNFRSALGKADTAALTGNLVTRIFHQNGCNETNVWASESISKCWRLRASSGTSQSDDHTGQQRISRSSNLSDSHEFEVPPETFLHLRRGGPLNDYWVDCVISRPWASGRSHLRVMFPQL